jgi:uncharacterized protein YlaI
MKLWIQPRRVLVKLDQIDSLIKGLSDPIGTKRLRNKGIVTQVGEECDLQVGDHVCFMPNSGSEIDGYYLVEEDNVLYTME